MSLKQRLIILSSFFFLSQGVASAQNAPLHIVTSIKPLQSLVSAITNGTNPDMTLLIDGAGSPHNYTLKPSQADGLQKADVVFWIGHNFEVFLNKPLHALEKENVAIAMDQIVAKEEHGHEEHHEDEHDDHADEHHDHEDGDEEEGHHHEGGDPHLWLDPALTIKMSHVIADALVKIDPAHKTTYQENSTKLIQKLTALDEKIQKQLSPVKNVPFVTFHDAYDRFSDHFGINMVASITISPEKAPSAKRLKHIRDVIAKNKVRCVFGEPQFKPKLVQVVIEGTGAQAGTLDPLGMKPEAGQEHYFQMMDNIASALETCLSSSTQGQ